MNENLLDSGYLITQLDEILNKDDDFFRNISIDIEYEENDYLGYDIEFSINVHSYTWSNDLSFNISVDFDIESDGVLNEEYILGEIVDNIADEIEDVSDLMKRLSSDILSDKNDYFKNHMNEIEV